MRKIVFPKHKSPIKILEISGGRGGVIKDPLERKILGGGGGGVQIKKSFCGGGVWIFSGTTHYECTLAALISLYIT